MEENFLYNYNNINENNNNTKERNISYKMKSFNNIIDKLILNVKKISKILSKQIIGSNFLIKEIMIEKQYSKTIMQLYDRIGMLEDSRRLLEENIKSINYNIKHFFKEIDKEFVFDNNNKINNINIKEYNNNIQYKTLFNNNYIKPTNTLDDYNFYTINDFNYKIKNKSKSRKKTNYEKYINTLKKPKKNNSTFSHNHINENEFNDNIFSKNDLNYFYISNNNKNKKSRNAKMIQSYHSSLNIKNTTSNTIINKNNYINRSCNNVPNKKTTNITIENYPIILAKNVIKFLNLIKEMKVKYNKKDSIYNSEFKKVKLLYDKLKIYIMNLSKKVIDTYSNKKCINKNMNNINSKDKENIKIIKNINVNNNKNLLSIKKLNLLTENNIHFSYIINQTKENKENIISKEISFYFIEKINNFNYNKIISEIHETELIILKDEENIKNYNTIISELQEKNKILSDELDKYKKELDIDIDNKNEESRGDKEQIELLLNENQELKNQLEEYKESNNMSMSNSKEDLEKYYKDIINENESKIKFLTEQNNFYENEIKKYKENNNKDNSDIINLKVENSIIQKEYEDVKKQNQFLNQKIKEYKVINNLEDIIPEKYDIICDKNFEKLTWILIRQKEIIEENDYENYIWIAKNLVNNLEGFNFITEEESIKRQIMNYITQLEEKDDIIFKLKQKLNKYEKSDE